MGVKSYRDLIVWRKAEELTVEIYKCFTACRDYSFRDQIQRASVSIMNNVAEGYARQSDQALASFLTIARGSAAEVESMLSLAAKLDYIDSVTQKKLLLQTEEVAKLLTAFRSKVRQTKANH